MARARNIKPGFFRNDRLAECGPLCMIVFEGLWCIADYRGNLEYRPKRIKIDTIPYFEPSDYGIDGGIDGCIDILAKAGFVELYEVNDTKYLHVVNFEKHQNPHKNERDTETPIPGIEKARKETEEAPEANESNPADSLILNTDSLIKDIVDTEEPDPLVPFSDFWEAYPRKENKAKAEKAWAKIKCDPEKFQQITEHIEKRFFFQDWSLERKEFIPHASTFLNQSRWNDEIIDRRGSNAKGKSASSSRAEYAKNIYDFDRATDF